MTMAWFFIVPAWVDLAKPAGKTSQLEWARSVGGWNFLRDTMTGVKFFHSPWTLLMFTLSLVSYWLDPYDIAAAQKGWAMSWVGSRTLRNLFVALAFYSFFLLVPPLACVRKFNSNTSPSVAQLIHDVWYWFLGILQWSVWECLFLRSWGAGRIQYISDGQLFTPLNMIVTLIFVVTMPAWRSVHFYCMHRMSHIRPFYKAFHALHHRNLDVEAFSGLAMHPVEHLYYMSALLVPCALFATSPFVLRYGAYMTVLVPGATHSGYEDHLASQPEHYVHHISFNKNFGAGAGVSFDHFFGTFADKIEGASGPAGCPKATLMGLPSVADFGYASVSLLISAFFLSELVGGPSAHAHLVAASVAFGPIVAAFMMWALTDTMTWRWPFEQQQNGNFWFHIFVGCLLTVAPVYYTVLQAV